MTVITITANHDDRQFPILLDLDPALPNERTILGFLQAGQFYEPEVSQVMLRALHPGDVAVDVGANVGFFTVLMGLLTAPDGHVVCFEPDAENRARLMRNIELNRLTNITLIEEPASAEVEDVTFYRNSDNAGGHSIWDPGEFPPNERSRAHPDMARRTATTVGREMARLGFGTPRLIKVDTEGAEHRVLEGARVLLADAQVPYVVGELHEFGLERLGSSQAALRRFMQDLGYGTFAVYPDGSLPKLIPPATRLISRDLLNILFSTPTHVGELWPLELVGPALASPPAENT